MVLDDRRAAREADISVVASPHLRILDEDSCVARVEFLRYVKATAVKEGEGEREDEGERERKRTRYVRRSVEANHFIRQMRARNCGET